MGKGSKKRKNKKNRPWKKVAKDYVSTSGDYDDNEIRDKTANNCPVCGAAPRITFSMETRIWSLFCSKYKLHATAMSERREEAIGKWNFDWGEESTEIFQSY